MRPTDDQAVEFLTEMVRTPSLCGSEEEVAQLMCASMEDWGFEDVGRDAAGNVLGRVGPADAAQSVVLLGHMDTVPGEIPVEIRDGALYGRGSVDAKGPLSTAVVAAARAAERTSARIIVAGAVQEEGPSSGARYLAQAPAPDMLVIAEPGGWDAIVLGYKGSQRFTASITIPTSHSAGPEPTAAELAFDLWTDIRAWCRPQETVDSRRMDGPECPSASRGAEQGSYPRISPPLRRSGLQPDVGVPAIEGVASPRDRAPIFNQLSPTLLSTDWEEDGLQETASLYVSLRLPPGIDPAWVQEAVPHLAPHAEFSFYSGEPAVRCDRRSRLASRFARSIRDEGGTPRHKVKTGTSDMNVVLPVWNCQAVAYGPGDSHLDHTPDEHLQIDEYLSAVRVLTRVLEEL
jgi:LysW-gamma-L-lysine carboxypeptidase